MLHRWDITPREAVELQRKLRELVRTDLSLGEVRTVAGVDVGYRKSSGESVAAVCALEFPSLRILETHAVRMRTPFPYVPGLLSFREIPPILAALDQLSNPADLILVDGHGRAHPRRMGIAVHLGLWLQRITIGVGKSKLCGEFREPGPARGSQSQLEHRGDVIGSVLRTRTGVKPVFVSEGYGLPLPECVKWVLRLAPRFRLPEPIRIADRLSKR